MLAGMSTDYYTRLERGNLSGVSGSVLDALARALQLDEAERTHLFDLAATANAPGQTGRSAPGGPGPGRPRRSLSPFQVREGVLRVLDGISGPAYVRRQPGFSDPPRGPPKDTPAIRTGLPHRARHLGGDADRGPRRRG